MDAKRRKKLAGTVGGAIANMRLNADMTQDDVALSLGIGSEAVSRMERGAVIPSVVRLFEFSDLFRCRVDELLLGSSDRPDDQAAAIAHRIRDLHPSDRQIVADIVAQLTDHLRRAGPSRRGPR